VNSYPYPANNAPPIFNSSIGVKPKFPTPAPSTSVIAGRLMNARTETPLPTMAVYLADLVPLTPGPGHLISVVPESSIMATTDQSGYFALTLVKPGTYALVIWNPLKSSVIPNPQDPTRELLVTVEAGQLDDLGEISIDF
jgi:hypothetical protein